VDHRKEIMEIANNPNLAGREKSHMDAIRQAFRETVNSALDSTFDELIKLLREEQKAIQLSAPQNTELVREVQKAKEIIANIESEMSRNKIPCTPMVSEMPAGVRQDERKCSRCEILQKVGKIIDFHCHREVGCGGNLQNDYKEIIKGIKD